MIYHIRLTWKTWGSWQIPSLEVYDLSEENGLDTYMSIEVPVPEGDEARSLTQEELGQGQEAHCWFNHGSTCTTSVFPKDTDDVWFLDQAIWREEHTWEHDLKKLVEECKDPEWKYQTTILYMGLLNQRTTWSSGWRSREYINCNNHLEWPPKIMRFIYSRNVC